MLRAPGDIWKPSRAFFMEDLLGDKGDALIRITFSHSLRTTDPQFLALKLVVCYQCKLPCGSLHLWIPFHA